MSRTKLPDDDHVVRYVKPSLVDGDKVSRGAFCLRQNEKGLSVNWLEAFNGDRDYQLDRVRMLCNLQLKKTGRFAELNVSQTKLYVLENTSNSRNLCFIHDPQAIGVSIDRSHSLITGLPPIESHEAMLVGQLIAECVNSPLHPGISAK